MRPIHEILPKHVVTRSQHKHTTSTTKSIYDVIIIIKFFYIHVCVIFFQIDWRFSLRECFLFYIHTYKNNCFPWTFDSGFTGFSCRLVVCVNPCYILCLIERKKERQPVYLLGG